MSKIRTGDRVIVIAGKSKGVTGTVKSMLGDRCIVEGINIAKKHIKPNPLKNEIGGVVSKNLPIHISNIALFNPVSKKADRIGYRFEKKNDKINRKVRFFKSDGKTIDA